MKMTTFYNLLTEDAPQDLTITRDSEHRCVINLDHQDQEDEAIHGYMSLVSNTNAKNSLRIRFFGGRNRGAQHLLQKLLRHLRAVQEKNHGMRFHLYYATDWNWSYDPTDAFERVTTLVHAGFQICRSSALWRTKPFYGPDDRFAEVNLELHI